MFSINKFGARVTQQTFLESCEIYCDTKTNYAEAFADSFKLLDAVTVKHLL